LTSKQTLQESAQKINPDLQDLGERESLKNIRLPKSAISSERKKVKRVNLYCSSDRVNSGSGDKAAAGEDALSPSQLYYNPLRNNYDQVKEKRDLALKSEMLKARFRLRKRHARLLDSVAKQGRRT